MDSFNANFGSGGTVNTIALQADGKILVGVNFSGAENGNLVGVARLQHGDGRLDGSFGSLKDGIDSIAIRVDGKILISGGSHEFEELRNGSASETLEVPLALPRRTGSGWQPSRRSSR